MWVWSPSPPPPAVRGASNMTEYDDILGAVARENPTLPCATVRTLVAPLYSAKRTIVPSRHFTKHSFYSLDLRLIRGTVHSLLSVC